MERPTIRTYKIRGTRITNAQTSSINAHWAKFGIEPEDQILDPKEIFPNADRVVMEIGFGMGESTAQVIQQFPKTGFIGVEVHQPGIGALMIYAAQNGSENLRIIEEDATFLLAKNFADNSLDAVHLFFPDPWPKTKHNKRRIVQPAFVALIAAKLKTGGEFRIATDWKPYADYMESVFAQQNLLIGGIVERPEWRSMSKFESKGIRKKHIVTDFLYTKV